MDRDELQERQKELIDRMSRTPVVPARKPDDDDEDDYRNLCNKLKTLADIEKDQRELELKGEELSLKRREIEVKEKTDMARIAADEYKTEVEDRKSKRESGVKLVTQGLGIGAGYFGIFLTGLLESDRLIRSKAWQFGSKMLAKWL